MTPETWRVDEKDRPVMNAVLQMGGFDFDAPDVIRGLTNVHPIMLPRSRVELLSEEEQKEYWAEVAHYKAAGHPDYESVELPA